MFKRKILSKLEAWKRDERHKPLILRGARQVGKTTVVNEFGSQFDNYLYFNLEMIESVRLFEMDIPLNDLVNMLFASSDKSQREGCTLIFIDEIQNSPKTIALLRYFYEQRPDLYVIAAGGLLENLVDVNVSFPVGRVMYMALRPCSFYEFLGPSAKPIFLLFSHRNQNTPLPFMSNSCIISINTLSLAECQRLCSAMQRLKTS